jgi:hypothetical protein
MKRKKRIIWYCDMCGTALFDGDHAYATTVGDISEKDDGFVAACDEPWLTVACKKCGEKISDALCRIINPEPKAEPMMYLLFTCDDWQSYSSMVLRGIFPDRAELEKARSVLLENNVIRDIYNNTLVYEGHVGVFEVDGGYICPSQYEVQNTALSEVV